MTAADLSALITALRPLGISERGLARMWGYRSGTAIRQMLSGKQAVNANMGAWLVKLAQWARVNPPG